MYMPKRAKYISNGLAGRILQYIDESGVCDDIHPLSGDKLPQKLFGECLSGYRHLRLLHPTRERVRQIEAKARRKFSRYYSHIRLITRISAEKNGASTVSSNDIEDYCKTNVTERNVYKVINRTGLRGA